MLKLLPWGLFTAIGLQCLHIINGLLLLAPSNSDRFQHLMQSTVESMSRGSSPLTSLTFSSFAEFSVGAGLAAAMVILFFLIGRRKAFMEASRRLVDRRA